VRLLFSILTFIVVAAGLIFFVGPMLISTDEVRGQIFAQIESATGYRLRVDGPVKFSLFPSLHLVANDVGVAQGAPGTPEIAKAKTLRFGLDWSALWGGKVQLTELALIDPVIAVPSTKQPAPQGAPAGNADGTGGGSPLDTLQRLSLDKLTIENGTVILPPSNGAPGKRIEALNLTTALPSLDSPLNFDASGVYDGKKLALAGQIASLGDFLQGTPTPITLDVTAPAYLSDKGSLKGIATYRDGSFALTKFSAKAGDKAVSATALLYKGGALTVSELNARMGANTLSGNASYKDNILTLNPFSATGYGNTVSGSLAANLSGKVPAFNAALTAKTLNVDALMAKSGGGGGARAGGGGGGGAAASSSGWSDAKIDFSGLRAANGKLKLTAQQLIYVKVKISPVTLDATLANGKLTAQLPGLKLYNGTGGATLVLDASGKTPTQALKLNLAKFDAYPLLRDATNFQNIDGTGTIALNVTTSGASQRAMISALNGTANLDFANGAIRGINIAKTVRNLTTGIVNGWQGNQAEKTDFASLGASFKIAQGQATTNDLHLMGPLVRMTGAGTANLPAKSLKFRVEPQIVASLEGQGGKSDLQGLKVPVMITGPWANPKIYPDLKGILENPQAAYEQLRQLGGGLVSLPGADKLGTVGSLPANIIKDGKINKDALKQGLDQLLNQKAKPKANAAAPAAKPKAATVAPSAGNKEADAAPAPAPAAKPKKKQKSKDAAKQILQNLLQAQ
jgi:AsmA protein